MLQNSQAKAHTNSAKQRLSETQYLKNEKRRKQRQRAIPPFAWNESCCLNSKKGRLKTQYGFQTTLSHSFRQLLTHRRQSLTAQTALLEAVSPQQILERGFSVVKNTRGQVIRNADTLKQGQKLHITFADGETDVRVTKKQAQGELFD